MKESTHVSLQKRVFRRGMMAVSNSSFGMRFSLCVNKEGKAKARKYRDINNLVQNETGSLKSSEFLIKISIKVDL